MDNTGGRAPRRTSRQTVGRSITWNWTWVIALQITNPQLSKKENKKFWQIGCASQMGAWHQDGLADWLSVVI
jgi:hypothetical protein